MVKGGKSLSTVPKIALVGCGYWGKNLCRNFYALGALAAVVDATENGQATARSLAPNAIISDNFDVSVVRYFTVFGPAGRPDMSPYRFIKWIAEGETIQMFGDGSQSRDFTYVDDIARGSVAAIQDVGYEIINLGGGRNPVSLNTMIEKLETLIAKKAVIDYKPFHIADLMETWADIEKARNLLGWEPRVSLDEGLEKSVSWYMQNREWLRGVKV